MTPASSLFVESTVRDAAAGVVRRRAGVARGDRRPGERLRAARRRGRCACAETGQPSRRAAAGVRGGGISTTVATRASRRGVALEGDAKTSTEGALPKCGAARLHGYAVRVFAWPDAVPGGRSSGASGRARRGTKKVYPPGIGLASEPATRGETASVSPTAVGGADAAAGQGEGRGGGGASAEAARSVRRGVMEVGGPLSIEVGGGEQEHLVVDAGLLRGEGKRRRLAAVSRTGRAGRGGRQTGQGRDERRSFDVWSGQCRGGDARQGREKRQAGRCGGGYEAIQSGVGERG